MDNDGEGVSRVYDDLGVHGGHVDDREKLRMAFVLSGIHMQDDLFREMQQLSRQAEVFFAKVRTRKIQIDSYIGEVEQMMAYLLIHQELCEQSRGYEGYPLLSSLQSKLNTKKILTLWKSVEYITFCQRQKYYPWLRNCVCGDDSQEALHVIVDSAFQEHVHKVESLYGGHGWTLYPEEREDE